MGIVLAGIVIVLCVASIAYIGYRWDNCTKDNALIGAGIGAFISGIIVAVILIAVVADSYSSYVDTRTKYDATITQYKESITMYKDYATIDVGKAAFTDLKYQGYQKNMSNFVRDLRCEVTQYNEKLISKRIMKKNWFFNWVIIAPDDDMKILNMSD